ncbi:MAG: hypothetical protein HY651_00505 [Acidobacteria bacterium]|nr:hypothetical protein [Acidobacteriota bacterium]
MRRPFLLTSNLFLPSTSLRAGLDAIFLLITFHSSLVTVLPAQGIITTVAGNGRVIRGVGGPATSAALGEIYGVAVDSAGNVYASDRSNNQVVKISAAGILSIVAGNGILGYSGDGGLAISASLSYPVGLVVDGSGNLYIADRDNQRVRRVSPDGIITTVAGNGQYGFSGDGVQATATRLASPAGLAIDGSGNLYIADLNNHRVRNVDTNGIITTYAGDGVAGFAGDGGLATSASMKQPSGVAIDSSGNLYIADSSNLRVRMVSPAGLMSTVAGTGVDGSAGDGGPATSATLGFPYAVAVDAAGNLYIGGAFNGRIRKVNSSGTITTVAGGGSNFPGDGGLATNAALSSARGVAVDATGILYIGESFNARIRSVSSDGTITTLAGTGLTNFAGDGGPAISASLSQPYHVAVDADGNLYIADWLNHRIRKVSANGIISTVAGTGVAGYSGDGDSAVSASLKEPHGVEVDAAGNIYFSDSSNNRIRKISLTGVISTVAGGGSSGSLGDDGQATSASLRTPLGLAFDATSGNLFIADASNHRIRKVAPTGIITTVAGNGVGAYSGDGGQATSASLRNPEGVAVDAAGNLYIADSGNLRIRQVSPGGTITTVAGGGVGGLGGLATSVGLFSVNDVAVAAGNLLISASARVLRVGLDGIIVSIAGTGGAGFSGDGGPATVARFENPEGVALDEAGNVYIADTFNDRVRKVLALPPSFSVAPATLTFTAPAGAASVAPQQITVSSVATGLAWSAQVSTESGGNWLSITPAAGSAPGGISVSVNVAALQPGTYRGTVSVTAPLAAVKVQTISVSLAVQSAVAANLVVEPVSLTFEGNAGGSNPSAQSLRITNAGGGTLIWTAQTSTTTGGSWLTVDPASGSASGTSPNTVQVNAAIGSLAAGTYSGSILIQSPTTGQSVAVPVTFLVSQPQQIILLSQRGMLFTGVAGGGALPSQTFAVLNTGAGVMNWTAQATTLSGGNWLSVSRSSGTSTAGSLQPPLVNVNVSVAGLAAAQYSGQIRVTSAGASNSPQFLTVTLNVLATGSNPGVLVRPTGLLFIRPAGSSSPGSQTVQLQTAASDNVQAVVNPSTFSGGEWLNLLPRNLTVSSSDPRTITVQPTLESLAAGEYFGALTLLFSDLTVQTVSVRFVVTPSAGTQTSPAAAAATDLPPRNLNDSPGDAALEPCTSQRLFIVGQSLGSNFSVPVGYPALIQAQVKDDCDVPISDALVVASFDNGDASLPLVGIGDGIYQTSWQPSGSGQQIKTGRVGVSLRAARAPLAITESRSNGQIIASSIATASLNSTGLVNAASFAAGEPLAPGSIVSASGENMAQGLNYASQFPLGTSLGGATLTIGGIDAPLFFSASSQIYAQIPFELAPNSRPSVVLRTTRPETGTQTAAVSQTITLAAARPAIFTTNQQPAGPGVILNQDGSLNSASRPAARGSLIQIYATGLGTTSPPVASGQPAPSNPPATTTTVQAQIGGQTATVQFAGLTPGYVGLYRADVIVPAGVTPGNAVPLVLAQDGVPSNTVTLAIQ